MFPARAGMNRASQKATRDAYDVPRPCGDEPEWQRTEKKFISCSPPVRG